MGNIIENTGTFSTRGKNIPTFCPFCGFHLDYLTKAHCEKLHNITKEEMMKKYEKEITNGIKVKEQL